MSEKIEEIVCNVVSKELFGGADMDVVHHNLNLASTLEELSGEYKIHLTPLCLHFVKDKVYMNAGWEQLCRLSSDYVAEIIADREWHYRSLFGQVETVVESEIDQ